MKANPSSRRVRKKGTFSSAVLAALLFSCQSGVSASYIDQAQTEKAERENQFFEQHPIRGSHHQDMHSLVQNVGDFSPRRAYGSPYRQPYQQMFE